MRRLLSLLVNLLIACVALGAGLFAAELLFQLIKPPLPAAYRPQQIYVSHFRASTLLPFELVKSGHERFAMEEFDTTIVTNSLGIRGPELDPARPKIAVMGDSLTFGYGVENDEVYAARMEALFGGKYQVVDCGFAAGLSPDMYALWLSARWDDVKPVGVVASIYENDYMDVALNRWTRDGKELDVDDPAEPDRIDIPGNVVTSDGVWMRDSRIARMPPWIRRLIKRSYTIGMVRDRILADAPNPPDPAQEHDDALAARTDRKFARALERLWTASRGHLVAIYRVFGSASYGQTGAQPPTRMDGVLAAFGAKHGVPILSNHDDFTAADFFPKNGHWRASGHQKVAGFLHGELVARGY